MTPYFKTAIKFLGNPHVVANYYTYSTSHINLDYEVVVSPATYSVWKRLTDTELIKELFR